MAPGKQAFRKLADHQHVHLPTREDRRHAFEQFHRAQAGEQIVVFPDIDLRGEFGAVRLADAGQPGGAEQHRVRPADCRHGVGRDSLARVLVELGADRIMDGAESDPGVAHCSIEDGQCGINHLGADAVARYDGDLV